MANYKIEKEDSVSHISSPSVAVSLPVFGPINDAYPWLPPLVIYDRRDKVDELDCLALARRPFLSANDSCISVNLPPSYLRIEKEDIVDHILSSLSEGQGVPVQFDDGSTLFELALDCQGNFSDKDVALLAELFLDTSMEVPQPGFDRFVSLVQRCEKQGGINFSDNTSGYMRRTKLLSFVQPNKLQETSAPRPKF